MKYQLLGPVRAFDPIGAPLPFEPRHLRILAMLLLSHNHTVGRDQLIDAVWDDHPPATADRQLQNCLSVLRQRLPDDERGGSVLVTDPSGYSLRVPPDTIDATVFGGLTASAHGLAAAGHVEEAVATLRQGLALWRGQALSGMHGRSFEAGAARLNEQRLIALEECLDLELRLGHAQRVIGELKELVGSHPMREGLIGTLMRALHRAGRQPEALAEYDRLREVLAGELGLDPSPQLRELHAEILRDAPAMGGTALPSGPRQLPTAVRHFVGRTAQRDVLMALAADARAGHVVIAAVEGAGGVGKTALAVSVAHELASQFPDGQLFVNLRGFDHTHSPVSPADALRGFLDGLGVPAGQIPNGFDTQLNLYRSLVNGRRVLIVLDNAYDAEQVRPLLPGNGPALVLVTSRHQLTGLIVAEGGRVVGLDRLSGQEAHDMLAIRLGADRLRAEPEAVAALIRHCAHLPLALAIIAARAAAVPTFPISTFAAELADSRRRLDAVDGGDPYTQMRAVFSWSFQRLPSAAAHLFRLLGLHPGPDISVPAAASLAGQPLPEVRRQLTELTRARLLNQDSPGRYSSHDLLSAYAQEQARLGVDQAEQHAVRARILDHYLHTAYCADRLLYPRRDPLDLPGPAPGVTAEPLSTVDDALAWFAAEHHVLLAAVDHAAAHRSGTVCQHLAWSMASYLERRSHTDDWISTQGTALRLARTDGDTAGQAAALRSLGRASISLADHVQAQGHLTEALGLFTALGDRVNAAHARVNLAQAMELAGRFRDAIEHCHEALTAYRAAGHALGQANALNSAGYMHALLDEPDQAIALCREALDLHKDIGHQLGEANTLHSIGFAHHRRGETDTAVELFGKAVRIYREIGDGYHEAIALIDLGDVQLALGLPHLARQTWTEALAACERFKPALADSLRARLAGLPAQ
ncbi:AfsR/SARP family transcriptional regulator [Allorhizocola rhizosphaerae]|uniref:AfsR/SARP family transcriptional regulator n=1 Tax=Allorhizocola rhizosphaerae TaxID=1872709 RepID=UPI0013C2FDD5|nr:BTAD domain-containing putative transcriptional regulator [Allorhizocola rhizosphaerae]